MIITTTKPSFGTMNNVECGVVVAERVLLVNSLGTPNSEESGAKALQDIRDQAEALGADAVVAVKIKYRKFGRMTDVMMVTVSGIAVKLEQVRVQVVREDRGRGAPR